MRALVGGRAIVHAHVHVSKQSTKAQTQVKLRVQSVFMVKTYRSSLPLNSKAVDNTRTRSTIPRWGGTCERAHTRNQEYFSFFSSYIHARARTSASSLYPLHRIVSPHSCAALCLPAVHALSHMIHMDGWLSVIPCVVRMRLQLLHLHQDRRRGRAESWPPDP